MLVRGSFSYQEERNGPTGAGSRIGLHATPKENHLQSRALPTQRKSLGVGGVLLCHPDKACYHAVRAQ